MSRIITVDIGGSHISSTLVDTRQWKQVFPCHTSPVNAFGPAADILKSWSDNLGHVLAGRQSAEPIGLAVAMPGPFDYATGRFLPHPEGKFGSLAGQRFHHLLLPQLPGVLEVAFENDAGCFGLGEANFGAGFGCRKVIGITLGTGIGSCFIDEGQLLKSGTGIPVGGEIFALPFAGSIADDYFSTRWFVRTGLEKLGIEAEGLRELMQLAPSDKMDTIFQEFGDNLVRLLLPIALQFAAERIVLGGNIARAWKYFSKYLSAPFAAQGISVQPGLLGERAVHLGAARMFLQKQGAA